MNKFTVTALNDYIKDVLASDFLLQEIYVEGEVADYKKNNSGHLYFLIKDESSKIKCAFYCYKNEEEITLENGMKVFIKGKISTYDQNSTYQINVDYVEELGIGKLKREFRKTLEKLEKEGLFDEEFKQEIPKYPRRLGLIASSTSAGFRDIVKVLRRRTNMIDIILYDSFVQGDMAVSNINSGLDHFNQKNDVDLILIARGGGSYEELAVFNDESMARKIFASKIPVMTAVGHQIDSFIADLVADKRCATPSEAAEIISRYYYELPDLLDQNILQISFLMNHYISSEEANLRNKRDLINSLNTKTLIDNFYSKTNNLMILIKKEMDKYIYAKEKKVDMLASRLIYSSVSKRIDEANNTIDKRIVNINQAMNNKLSAMTEDLQKFKLRLTINDIYKTLRRGYFLISDLDNKTIKDANNIKIGSYILIKSYNSSIKAHVLEVNNDIKLWKNIR